MAYNKYDAYNQILNAKKGYESITGTDEESERKKKSYADYAQPYYKQLADNGDTDLANYLKNNNYENSKNYYSKITSAAKSGQTAFRPYMETAGKKYSLGKSDINKLTRYDESTGEVSFGGINLGKPNAEIDGTAYYDPAKMDSAMSEYVKKSGTTPSLNTTYNQGQNTYGDNLQDNRDYFKKNQSATDSYIRKTNKSTDNYIKGNTDNLTDIYYDNADYTKNYNPYTSSIGKAIMQNYGLKGYESALNEKASSAASNGGNIDSYAAANAARQRLAYTNAGTQAVLNDYQNRLGYLWGGFDSLGNQYSAAAQNLVNSDGNAYQSMLANNQTAQQNLLGNSELEQNRLTSLNDAINDETTRELAIADMTGYISEKYADDNVPWLDEDGNFIPEFANIDFQQRINDKRAEYNSTTDDNRKKELKNEINQLLRARRAKIMSNLPEFGQYADTLEPWTKEETGPMREGEADRNSAKEISLGSQEVDKYGIDAEKEMNAQNNAHDIEMINAELESKKDWDKYLKESSESGAKASSKSPESSTSVTVNALSGDKPYSESTEAFELYADNWVNFLENEAKKKGLSDILIPIGNGSYQISNEDPGYRTWIDNCLRKEYANGSLSSKGLNYMLKKFNLI